MTTDLITLKYVGRHPEIEVDPDGFGKVYVVNGESLDVPVEEGARLLLQPANWALVPDSKKLPSHDTKAVR